MPKKIGTLIESLLKKVGIDTTKDEFKTAIAIAEELPDAEAEALEKNLLTIDAAKSNTEVIKKVKAEIYNGADSKIAATLAELELEADDDFSNEKNTFEKIAKLAKMAKAAGEKKAGAGNSKDKNEFAEKERLYNQQLKELKETLAKQKTEFETTRENDFTSFELQKILGGKNYVFPKEMDASLQIKTALGVIEAELGKKELSIKRNAAGQLTIVNKDGNPAFSDTNVALEPNSFIDGALAQNKLLKIQESNPGGGPKPGDVDFIPGAAKVGNVAIAAEIQQQLQAMD